MAKKVQTQKEQQDLEDELLNFDLQDLSDDDILAEDDVIELVELVEPDQDEDKTKELPVKSLGREKRAPKGAAALKAAPMKEAVTPPMEKAVSEDDEERELDLSDLTLDMDVETTKPAETSGDDVITEADLENLLQETSEEDISFDLSAEGEGGEGIKEEEVTDADLEALLQEATAEDIKDTEEGTAEEKEILGIVPETEVSGEVKLEEEEASLEDAEFVADSFEETQSLSEPEAEREVPVSALTEAEEPRAAEAVPLHEEVAVEEPPAEKLVGISEERLEEILTRVVQDVVERVARETLASVAERVIGQAIEALRESLESSSEES